MTIQGKIGQRIKALRKQKDLTIKNSLMKMTSQKEISAKQKRGN